MHYVYEFHHGENGEQVNTIVSLGKLQQIFMEVFYREITLKVV